MRERLQKILAQCGRGSRRDCEDLIRDGRVSVDGKMVEELGLHVDPEKQSIKVDGERLKLVSPCYFLLNKPPGVVCTMAEDERSPRAVDFAPKGAGRVHTIGRLDKESEGLIILTNDGDLTERLTHPRHDMPKTYLVTVGGGISEEALSKMKKGVWLSEGKAKASSAKVLRHTPYATLLEIELREGKNREIRRILARVGYKVKQLKRVAIGPIRIAGLALGATRLLTPGEVAILYEAVGDEKKAGLASRGAAAVAAAKGDRRNPAGAGAKTGAARGAPGAKPGKAPAKAGKAPATAKGPGPHKAPAKAAKGKGGASPATPPAPPPPPPPPPPRPLRDSLPAFEPVRIVGKDGAAPRPPAPAVASVKPRPASKAAKAAKVEQGKSKPEGKGAHPARRVAPAAPAGAPARPPRLPAPPDEPPAAALRRTYTPDEDGVIVVRRPAPQERAFDESEEE